MLGRVVKLTTWPALLKRGLSDSWLPRFSNPGCGWPSHYYTHKESILSSVYFCAERLAALPFLGLHGANPHDSYPAAARCGDQGECAAAVPAGCSAAESKIPTRRDDIISAQGTGRVPAPALHVCGQGRAWCPISLSSVPESALYGPPAVTSPLRRRRTTFTARNCHFLNALAASLPARGYPLTACPAVGTPCPGSPAEPPPRPGMSCACLPAGSIPCRRLFPRQLPVERPWRVGIRVEPKTPHNSGKPNRFRPLHDPMGSPTRPSRRLSAP